MFGEDIGFRRWIEEAQVTQFSPVSKKLLLQSIPARSDSEYTLRETPEIPFPTEKTIFSELPHREKQKCRDRRTPPGAFLSRIRQAWKITGHCFPQCRFRDLSAIPPIQDEPPRTVFTLPYPRTLSGSISNPPFLVFQKGHKKSPEVFLLRGSL